MDALDLTKKKKKKPPTYYFVPFGASNTKYVIVSKAHLKGEGAAPCPRIMIGKTCDYFLPVRSLQISSEGALPSLMLAALTFCS